MNEIHKILCPVDLSDNSLAAIELASLIAKQSDAKLVFIYVAPQWLPEEAMFGSEFVRSSVAEDKEIFQKLRPADDSIQFDHIFAQGNPGPEIVKTARNFELVVMSTHGQSGIMRLVMGSIAQYVLRHATCSVVSFKNVQLEKAPAKEETNGPSKKLFVTDCMRHVRPIRGFDKVDTVIVELDRANETGAPVVDDSGCCIGILTKTDIQNYRELQKRFEERDPTVVDEIFETDEFGQRRAGKLDFDQVHRQMTSPVVTISNTQTYQQALELFEKNKNIHHLVVVDEADCPIGIVDTLNVDKASDLASNA